MPEHSTGSEPTLVFRKNFGSEQVSKSVNVALGKMPGSEGNHGQTAEHRQYFVSVAGWGAPSYDTVRHKCGVMHSGHEFDFTGADLMMSYRCHETVMKLGCHELKHKAAMSRR